MSQAAIPATKPLPTWALRLGTLVIILHFLAIGMLVLSAQSGPWPTRFGDSTAIGPLFAGKINEVVMPVYLERLRMTHNYHFTGNRLLVSSVYFEAKLKDAKGDVFKTVKFPDETDNFWLRHRHNLVALGLGNDQPVQVSRAEVIPAPGQPMRQVTIWDNTDSNLWKLKEVPEHLVPKDRPVMHPSDWSLLLARAYQRYLCRHYDAASVELIRHSKDPVMPGFMFGEGPLPGTFDELVCSFGEYSIEK